jgi:exosortase/archaeosortase family protein
VLVRYKKVDGRILLGLGAGLVVTWFSNILRMAATVLVGSIWGHPALATFHSYIGIIVFVVFITVFWVLILRWLDKVEEAPPSTESKPISTSAEQ